MREGDPIQYLVQRTFNRRPNSYPLHLLVGYVTPSPLGSRLITSAKIIAVGSADVNKAVVGNIDVWFSW